MLCWPCCVAPRSWAPPARAGFFDSETKLTASDAAAVDNFGSSVGISGNTAIVGAPRDDDAGSESGSAYLFAPALPFGADFNGDGIVNQLDLQIWQTNFGRTSPPELSAFGDADGDGDVDGRDLLEIQRKFGGPPLVAAATAVPEPGSLVLLLGAIAGLGWQRR